MVAPWAHIVAALAIMVAALALIVAPRAPMVASMSRMDVSMGDMGASMAFLDASMARPWPAIARLGRSWGASGRPRSRMGRTVGVLYAALGRAGPHQVANVTQLFPLEIAIWRSLIPKSDLRLYRDLRDSATAFFEILNFLIFLRFS